MPEQETTAKKAKAKPKAKSRRGHGEGSIYQRESDGRWVGSLMAGKDDEGNYKRYPPVYGKTQKDVIAKLDIIKEKLRKGELINKNKVTLNDRINHWLEFEIKPHTTEGTYEKYNINIKNHIKESIGKHPIQKISRSMMVEYLAGKEKVLSPETVKILLSMLRRVFDIAIIDEIIYKSPLLLIKRTKKVEKKKRRALTQEEEKKILETAGEWSTKENYNSQAYNILLTEYGTGLRRSEVLPLRKSDIDFKSRELKISRVYVMVRGMPKLEDRAKTDSSLEAIVIPEVLANHLEAIETAKAPNDYLFPAKDGGPINPNSFRRTFKRILKEAKVDETIRLHDLRHNFASQMVALDVHISLIQAQMRHSDINTTSLYSHTSMEGQRRAAAKLNDHLQGLLPPNGSKSNEDSQTDSKKPADTAHESDSK